MVIILFGLAGSGKNFVGELLAEHFGFYFYDADQLLPEEMLACIRQNQVFTQEMRDDLTDKIIEKIAQLKFQYTNIVISQALYKESNRMQIAQKYPDAQFIWVRTTEKNILSRLNEADYAYAGKIAVGFETPSDDGVVIQNDDGAAVFRQLAALFTNK